MNVPKNKANVSTKFPVTLFPFQVIISLNSARYLPIRLVKQSLTDKNHANGFFSKTYRINNFKHVTTC